MRVARSDVDAPSPQRILSSRIRSGLEGDRYGDGIEVVPGSASDTGLEVRLDGRTFSIGVLEVEDPIPAPRARYRIPVYMYINLWEWPGPDGPWACP